MSDGLKSFLIKKYLIKIYIINKMNKIIKKELLFGAKNYNPLDVVIKKGKGIYVTDVNNKKYIDFLSGYCAVNQGHCHPKLLKAIN